MEAKITYSREEVEQMVMADHLNRFSAPHGYEWAIGFGGYGKEIIIQLESTEKAVKEEEEHGTI